MRTWMFAVFSSALAVGCAPSAVTEILLVIDTDLEVPGELDAVRVTLSGPGVDELVVDGDLVAADLPRTVGLVSRRGTPEVVSITVEGLLREAVVVRRDVSTSFVPDEVRVLRVHLLRRCLDAACGADQTCGDEGCRPIHVGPDELPVYVQPPGRLDAGAPNAPDAALDATLAPRDGGSGEPDSSAIDGGGCPASSTCGTGAEACVCDACPCSVSCGAECAVECTDTTSCTVDTESGADVQLACTRSRCDVNARRAGDVSVDCEDGAACVIDCRNTSSCAVRCASESQCQLRCNGGGCAYTECAGAMQSCPSGITVCNRECP